MGITTAAFLILLLVCLILGCTGRASTWHSGDSEHLFQVGRAMAAQGQGGRG
jgi:hypothetical protein